MNRKPEKTLWVVSVQPRQFHGSASVPTCLYYGHEDSPEFGWSASVMQDRYTVNTNFKLELGEFLPETINRKTFPTAIGKEVTAMRLTRDFFNAILRDIEKEIPTLETDIPGQIKYSAKIIVAEPLNFQVETQKLIGYPTTEKTSDAYFIVTQRWNSCPNRLQSISTTDMV